MWSNREDVRFSACANDSRQKRQNETPQNRSSAAAVGLRFRFGRHVLLDGERGGQVVHHRRAGGVRVARGNGVENPQVAGHDLIV